MRLLAVVGCALLGNATMTLPRSAAWAQTVSSATVTEVLDSNQVFIQNQRAAVNSVAQRQQRVRTQAARASLRFSNGAVARLSHNSSLMVGQCAQLNRGTLLVNGSLNGCSTTTVAGVRGTIYTMEVTEDGETIIQVFEGEVAVGQRTDAPAPEDDSEDWDNDVLEDGNLEGNELENSEPGNDGLGEANNPPDSSLDGAPSTTKAAAPMADSHPKQFPLPLPIPDTTPSPEPESPDPPTTSDPATEAGDGDPLAPNPGEMPAETSETVEFNPDTVLVINEGQQVAVNADNDEAVVSTLTAEDFIEFLEGPLIQGFAFAIPGLGDLQNVFQRLFPGIPLPYGLPSIPSPIPPIRFPF